MGVGVLCSNGWLVVCGDRNGRVCTTGCAANPREHNGAWLHGDVRSEHSSLHAGWQLPRRGNHCLIANTPCPHTTIAHVPCALQGEPQRAKSSAHAAATMVLILAVSASSLLFVFRKQWAGAFSPDDDAAAALIVSCMPLVCVYITLDALGIGLLNSILRAVRLGVRYLPF